MLWTLVLILVASLKVKFSYWQLKGVGQLKTHFIFGHFFKLKSLNHLEILQEVYDRFKGSCKIAGIYLYTKPVAVVLDLDVVKLVLIKDFHNFEDRFEYKNEKYTLQYVNENLIMQPGTQIFLTDVDACTFVQYGRDLYMEYARDGKVYERFLYES